MCRSESHKDTLTMSPSQDLHKNQTQVLVKLTTIDKAIELGRRLTTLPYSTKTADYGVVLAELGESLFMAGDVDRAVKVLQIIHCFSDKKAQREGKPEQTKPLPPTVKEIIRKRKGKK